MNKIIDTVSAAWGWTGLKPKDVIAQNHFGNIIVEAQDGKYWRICPEELSCEVVAESVAEFEDLWSSDDFQSDWRMENLVAIASDLFGPTTEERVYCLKVPGSLGGEYGRDNLGTISLEELLSFSGDAGNQIKDLPDGASIEFKFID